MSQFPKRFIIVSLLLTAAAIYGLRGFGAEVRALILLPIEALIIFSAVNELLKQTAELNASPQLIRGIFITGVTLLFGTGFLYLTMPPWRMRLILLSGFSVGMILAVIIWVYLKGRHRDPKRVSMRTLKAPGDVGGASEASRGAVILGVDILAWAVAIIIASRTTAFIKFAVLILERRR